MPVHGNYQVRPMVRHARPGRARASWILSIVALSLMWAVALPAQSPVDVAREVFAALDSADWLRVAALSHPDALKRFHSQQVSEARDEDETRTDLSLPAEFRSHKPMYAMLFKVQSSDQLDAMPADVMLSHFLSMTHPRLTRGANGSAPQRLHITRRILGNVQDGDSVAYVLFIETMPLPVSPDSVPGVDPDLPLAMTFRRDGGAWKTMLDGGLVWGMGGYAIAADDDH